MFCYADQANKGIETVFISPGRFEQALLSICFYMFYKAIYMIVFCQHVTNPERRGK